MEQGDRKVQYLVAFAVSWAAMTSSASISWATPVITKFNTNETNINITDTEISWMLSITSPGLMAGSITSGYISDKFGRRATLLGSALPFAVGMIFILLAKNTWMIFISRFLWGCGSGMIATVSAIYIVEIADKDIRGTLTVGNRFMFNFGTFLVMSIGSFISYQMLSWFVIFLCFCYFGACWFSPETPYYLLKVGRVEDARKELTKLSGSDDEKMLNEKLSLMRSHVREEMRNSATAKELFTGKQYRKAIIVAVGLKITQLMSGSICIQQYVGRLMQDSKSGIPVSTAMIVFGALKFSVGILSTTIVDRVGRRPLLIYTFFGSSASLAMVGVYFFMQEVIGIDEETSSSYSCITFIGIVLYSVISTVGFDTLIFIIPAEIFPINVKSIAMTYFNIFSAFISFLSIKAYQGVKDLSGLYGVFWLYSSAALLGAIFTYFVVPETRGKSLKEIQIELQGSLYDEANERLKQVVSDNNEDENKLNGAEELNTIEPNEEQSIIKEKKLST